MVIKLNQHLDKNYVLNRKSGRSIIERRPVFSPDGESLIVIVENILRVYNIHTGDWVSSLETETHIDCLVGVEFPEQEDYNLYGCSNNGLLTTWTWEKGAVLREVHLKIPHNTEVVSFNLINDSECFVLCAHPMKQNLHAGSYCTKTGVVNIEYVDTVVHKSQILCVSIGVFNGEKIAAIVTGHCQLQVQNLIKPDKRAKLKAKYRLLSVSVSKDGAIAATDTLGRMIVYRGNICDKINVGSEVLHWHALPLYAVHFSNVGSYILSGGMEKVLVKWTISTLAQKANEKKFIPRLPGFIRFITSSNHHIAVTLSNNSVVIADMLLHVTTTILECGGLSSARRSLGSSVIYHKKMSALIVPGRTGYLQMFSTTSDKVLYNIDITEVNSIPSERNNILPIETEVTCAATNAYGNWLATSEYRYDGTNYPEEKLKFWRFNNHMSPFVLNTCVSLSHGGCNLISIAFSHKGDFCVTAGNDQKFRIWKRNHDTSKLSWHCLTACYYSSGVAPFLADPVLNEYKHSDVLGMGVTTERRYLAHSDGDDVVTRVWNIHKGDVGTVSNKLECAGESSMGGVAISQDGSLIAAWVGCKVTVWDSHQCSMRTALAHPAMRPRGLGLQFGSNDAAHYLVATTENCLAVWSLLSLTLKWMVQTTPTCLIADAFSNRMAVVSQDNDVIVFTPHDPKPQLLRKRVLAAKDGVVRQGVFGLTTREDFKLYLLRNDSEIYCLEPEDSSKAKLEAVERRSVPASKFSTVLAEQQLSEATSTAVQEIQELNRDSLGHKAVAMFLTAASYTVPPLTALSTAFLELISGGKEIQDSVDEPRVDEEIQPSSDDEDSPKITPKPDQLCKANYEKIKEKKLKKILEQQVLDLEMTAEVFGL